MNDSVNSTQLLENFMKSIDLQLKETTSKLKRLF